jgi:leader peptidase (prepilin peptidase)/N-methyltransferase
MEREAMAHLVIGAFIWLLGLCIGSFLNVVIYRLPRGLGVSKPRRSFCPNCRTPIAWYDNIPVLSWLRLGGRCRTCRTAISVQYPLVEAITGTAFVLVYHLLAVLHARVGIGSLDTGDAPLVAAWLILAAAMIACAAMDLTAYIIDLRVTDVCLFAAIVLYALWPNAGTLAPTAQSPATAAAIAAALVSAVVLWFTVWRRDPEQAQDQGEVESGHSPTPAAAPSAMTSTLQLTVPLLVFAALAIWLLLAPAFGERRDVQWLAAPAALMALFIAIVVAGGQKRDADEEIHEAIEDESPHARRVALAELAWLMPAGLAGAIAWYLVANVPAAGAAWNAAVGWQIGPFQPVSGAAYSILGAIVGAVAGWVLRIVFTLAFGREAFGTGDIYILAAAGAAVGWDLVLTGLLLSVGLALVGWLLQLMLKSSGMIPFGPWLGLGFITALWVNRPIAEIASRYRDDLSALWQQQPHLIYAAGGIMLIGAAAAVIISRLLRTWLERGRESG